MHCGDGREPDGAAAATCPQQARRREQVTAFVLDPMLFRLGASNATAGAGIEWRI